MARSDPTPHYALAVRRRRMAQAGQLQAGMNHSTQSIPEMIRRRIMEPLGEGGLAQGPPDRHGAVFMCKDLIASLVSTLPAYEYTRTPDGLFEKVDRQPDFLDEPYDDADWTDYIYAQVASGLLSAGMAFGYVLKREVTDGGLAASRLMDLPPEVVSMRPRQSVFEPPQWRVEGRDVDVWPRGPLWIARGYPVAGRPIGLAPLELARLSVQVGMGARQFAWQFFRDGKVPAVVLRHPEKQGKAIREAVQQDWVDASDSREPRVVTGGWEFDAIRTAAEESQFLDTINANAADTARFFRVAPEDIGAASGGSSVTYANVEQRSIQLLVRTIGPWVVRLERRLSRLRPPGRVIRFEVDGLLRTDAKTRNQIILDQVFGGVLSVNEARALMDRPGIGEDGDRYVWPPRRQQLSEAETAGEKDVGSDPEQDDPEGEPRPGDGREEEPREDRRPVLVG